ncbi:oligoribonuclease-like [Tenebrio molitor]|uniref:oligoribonuclease-like n=1 Tax=Tenebrio molitor TaxID=7067 RepID=UPI003624A22A
MILEITVFAVQLFVRSELQRRATVAEYIVPVDVETTGLRADQGHLLLEIALRIHRDTAPFAAVADDIFHRVIRHDKQTAYELADDYVRQMHTDTGLWDELEQGQPLDEVDRDLLAYLQEHIGQREGRLTGNSLRLDMNFMETHLPLSAAYLHYRFLDATGMSWFLHKNFGIDYYEKDPFLAHTADGDMRECLNEIIHIHRRIAQLNG